MTTQEIVKALRCCAAPNCNECPLKPINSFICGTDDMMLEAADLIEAQAELIDALRKQYDKHKAD